MLNTPFDVTRIAVTNPAIADAVVVQPREVLIDGKGPGTVSLIVWGANDRRQHDVVVDPGDHASADVSKSSSRVKTSAAMNEESIILTGSVSSNAIMLRAGEIADGCRQDRCHQHAAASRRLESQQVLLQVRVAEVNRRAIKELGVSFFVNAS